MDTIRISDAALNSGRIVDLSEANDLNGYEHDSIDLIESELRKLISEKESSENKESPSANEILEENSKVKILKAVQSEDRFLDMMEQIEQVLNSESVKEGPEILRETKVLQTRAQNLQNSKVD